MIVVENSFYTHHYQKKKTDMLPVSESLQFRYCEIYACKHTNLQNNSGVFLKGREGRREGKREEGEEEGRGGEREGKRGYLGVRRQ